MPPRRSARCSNSYPTAPQIRDAYSQLPLQFGKQSFPTLKSKSKAKIKFPSSASGSNRTPLSTPEEVEARRQASNAWKVGRAPGKFIDVGGFRVPAPPLAEIEGRDSSENKKLAEGLKMMLEDDQGKEMEEVSPTTKSAPSRYQYEREALSKAFQQEYSVPHTDKRSNKDIIAGQEVGLGVIGSTHTPLHAVTAEGKRYMAKVVEGEHGCDTPLYSFEDARRGIAIPEGCLDPDLPPLAIEHPARIWNSLIHSLEPRLQPVLKWSYDNYVEGYIANLTLALPPTHPSIISHPLAMTVPKNSNSKEYIAVLELLGGVKKYQGEARKLKAEAQNCALVKCIADSAISWIYAPVTKGHVDAGKDDEVVVEMAGGEKTENEVGSGGIESDEIVIDIDIDDELEDVPEPDMVEQDEEYIEVEAFDKEALQEGYANGDIQTTPDVATAKMKLEEENYLTGLPNSQYSSCPSDYGYEDSESEKTEKSEEVPDLEEIEYSTDNSSEIDGWEAPTHQSSYKRMMSLLELAKEEELDSKIEFVVHEMKGFPGCSGNLYACHLLITWPKQHKAWAEMGRSLASSKIQAIRNLCHQFIAEDNGKFVMEVIRAERAPIGVNDRYSEGYYLYCQLIEYCHLNGLPSPKFGTCVVEGQIRGNIQIGDLSMIDSNPEGSPCSAGSISEYKLVRSWEHLAGLVLKVAGQKIHNAGKESSVSLQMSYE